MALPALDRLIDHFENLTPESVAALGRLYAPDAYFKDPFNEVTGAAAIERIFRHMFDQVRDPRFVITERIAANSEAMLVWEFRFRVRRWRPQKTHVVRGATHLRFDELGRVCFHRDYWDAAEELYAKLPLLGCVMRGLRHVLRA